MEQLLSDIRQLFVDIEDEVESLGDGAGEIENAGFFLKRLLSALNGYHHARLVDPGTDVQEVLDVLEAVSGYYRRLGGVVEESV